jgi:hypothetical protein
VHGAVHPVVPCILQNEEYRDLVRHLVDAGEGNRGAETEVLAQRMEEPDLGKLNCEMRNEDK